MELYPTPHIKAVPDDFANVVLMPGDPLRAKWIAENFLNDAVLVNNVRGIGGYTGYYRGKRISVMASGMGMPSMSIYSYELFNIFGVDTIIRIGTAGGLADDVNNRDIVLAQAACTDSAFVNDFKLYGTFAPIADFELLSKAYSIASKRSRTIHVGNVVSSDHFYHDNPDANDAWKKMGVIAVEMECAALYMNAARAKKRALGIMTVSDHLYKPGVLTSDERQTDLTEMIEIALDCAYDLATK